jgi:hypothetical protein
MDNYSQIFADTLALYESPYVPGDQGDAGKGQVLVRAGYTIHTTINANVGYIAKNPGQVQYHGVACDALLDRVDGSGADFLTDELQPDGRRLIKSVFTAYATPPPGTPITNWVQPTADYLNQPGPLVLKTHTAPPNPDAPPPSDPDVARFDAIDEAIAGLAVQLEAATAEILARDDANTEKIQQQIHQLVEDAEATLIVIAKVLLLFWRDRPPRTASAQQAVDELEAWIATVRRATHGR